MTYKQAQEIVKKMDGLESKFRRAVRCWEGNSNECGYGAYPTKDEAYRLMKRAFEDLDAYRLEVST